MQIYPNIYLNKVEDITIEMLEENGIKCLILDVDNTLVDLKKEVSKSIENWARNIKNCEIKLFVLSNSNDRKKVEKVAGILDAEFELFARKPLKVGFLKAKKKIGLDSNEIAAVGDQIFTDIIGANRCGMFSILVDPIDKKEFWYTAWKRPIEDKIKKNIKSKENKI